MAYLFDDANSECLDINQAILAGYPLAMVCWFNTNANIGQSLMWLGDKDVNSQEHSLMIYSTQVKIAAYTTATSADFALSSSTYSINTWQHACGIWVSATDRRVLLNGGSKGTNATSLNPTGFDRVSIGKLGRAAPNWYMSGMIAEAAIYDLTNWPGATDSDKADNFEKIIPSLAKGFSPLFYPLGLVAYWPLIKKAEIWQKQGIVITPTGGDWNINIEPTVIYEGNPQILTEETNVFKMWYLEYGKVTTDSRIMYAESVDGINWTKYGSNPVLDTGELLVRPFVMKKDSTYYLYVHSNATHIDRFYSSNGLGWTKDKDDTLVVGAGGQWDDTSLGNVCVWVEGEDSWFMLYEGVSSPPWKIGLATSSDGKTWSKSGSNPVLQDTGSCGGPEVHKIGSTYYVWYQNAASGGLPTDICRAKSTDLINWTKYGGSTYPVFWRTEDYEGVGNSEGQVADSSMVEVNGKTYMFYDAIVDQTPPPDFNLALAISNLTIEQLVQTGEMWYHTQDIVGGYNIDAFPGSKDPVTGDHCRIIYPTNSLVLGETINLTGKMSVLCKWRNSNNQLWIDSDTIWYPHYMVSYVREINDGVGILDAMNRSLVLLRILADGVGSVDNMGRTQVQLRIMGDALGITDAITRGQGFARSIADDIGMVDNVSRLMVCVRSLSETLGLTDAMTSAASYPRTIVDGLGITDSIARTQVQARIIADALGIVDDVSRVQTQLRTIADSLGLTDVMSPGQLIVFAEAMGMTDEITREQGYIRTFADTLGITDDLTRIAAYVFTQADDVGIADAMVRVAVALRTINDSVGITDAMISSSVGDLVKAAWAFMIIRQTHN